MEYKEIIVEEIPMRSTEQEVHSALQIIVDNQDRKCLNWCVNYAKAGLEMTGEALEIQCLYVLGNMTHWHGPEAQEVRKILKAFAK